MEKEELEKAVAEKEKAEETGVKPKKKGVWKYVLNISVVLIATSISLYFALRGNFSIIMGILATADIKYILIIVGLMVLLTCIRGLILYCFARLYAKKYYFHRALAVDQVGIFYNAVTPGATGGQIMQAYTYKKQGIPISASISILAMYSIVFQIVLLLFGTASFIYKYDFIKSLGSMGPFTLMEVKFNIPIWPLTILGFALNFFIIFIIFLMSYWHQFHNFIMGPVISFLAKIKILKHPDKNRESLRIQVENFKMEFTRLLTNIPFFILITVLFIIYFFIKFSIPFFSGMALDPSMKFTAKNLFDSIALSNYHQMVSGLIPLPGSAGVSELFFTQLFNNYFADPEYIKACLILWRTATFTLPLIIAGFVAAFYKASPKRDIADQEKFPNMQTMVALQNETYTARMEELNSTIASTQLSREAIRERLRALSKPKPKGTIDPTEEEYDEIVSENEEENK